MYYLGIDIGGTNIAVGLVDESGKLIAKHSNPTETPCTQEKFCDDVYGTAKELVEAQNVAWEQIIQVGVGCPGTANKELGTIEYANNLGFYDFPIRDMLSERFGEIKIMLDNDANAAAYGEYKAGALKGCKHGVAVTLGTGVGSGVVINGEIYSGFNFSASELGHTVIVADGRYCTCGRHGCWEAYSSATGLITLTKEYMEENKDSMMWELSEKIGKVSGRTSFDAMRLGDETAKKVVDEYIKYLGVGLSNTINAFQPEILCIGGGICNEGETLLAPLREICLKETYITSKRTTIVKAELGNDAGIIGAALLGV